MADDITVKSADNLDVLLNNLLLRSKRQNNLLESKIEVLAIKKLQSEPIMVTEKDSEGKRYTLDSVKLNAAELRVLMGREKSHSLYEQIRVAAGRMMQKYIVIEEPDTHQFAYKHYYHSVKYSDGLLDVVFEPAMSPYLKHLSANYTKLSTPILWSFDTNGAFQLYIHLRSYMYQISESPKKDVSQEEAETLTKEYNLAELRAELGYVDLGDQASDSIRAEASKKNPNWDKISNLEKKPKYKRWSDFSTRVLKPGIEEINEKSDIYVSKMEPIKTGRGGKIIGVRFYIQYNKGFYRKGASTDGTRTVDREGRVEEQYKAIPTETISEIMTIFPADESLITPVDAEILYNDAKGDVEKIRVAYDYAKKVDRITNFMGFMRKAVQNDYAGVENNVEVMNGSRKAAESYHATMDSIDKDADKLSANYWNRAKQNNTDKFQKFSEYLQNNGSSIELFEGAITQAECGSRFMDWIRTGQTEIF